MAELPKTIATGITLLGASVSWFFAVVEPWQEQIDWTLRIGASAIAIVAGTYALLDRRRKK